MKTWKIVGITGLLLASFLFCGAAQARRFDRRPNFTGCQNRGNYANYDNRHERRWAAAHERERFRHERGRHPGWERDRNPGWERGNHYGYNQGNHYGWERGNHNGADQGNHYGWGPQQDRMAARYPFWR